MDYNPKLKIEDLVSSSNIAEIINQTDEGKEYLVKLGEDVVNGYLEDKSSRMEWEQRQANSLKLALQVVESKSFPWQNASNVKFPLVTIAAMQFHARAYPALIDSPNVAKTFIVGDDPTGVESARGERISGHMNYQIFVEDESWEEQMDRALLALPIAGCIFKKTFFDPVKGINQSVLVLPNDLVVDYYATSLDTAQRITHALDWNKNTLLEKIRSGIFLDRELTDPAAQSSSSIDIAKDQSQGTNDSGTMNKAYSILEQQCYVDLDGDGYKEPYTISVREDTKQVFRIVAKYFDQGDVHRSNDGAIKRFEALFDKEGYQEQRRSIEAEIDRLRKDKDNKIVRITPIKTYVKYGFIPSPDGGFYDIGYGTLLGPLNASVDTLINQLIDSGTMSNTAGGFLGRGVKLRKGVNSFDPFEWKTIDSTGDDLRKNIFPLPVREPSQVLFTLLSLLVNYSERISGSTDMMTGQNPGQNTPAETSRTMVEQGMKIFSGIYKRVYRSLKEELKCLYRLNELYLEEQVHFQDLTTGKGLMINRADYISGNIHVVPEADPNIASDGQKLHQAMTLKAEAMSVPGFNLYEVEKRVLKALKIKGIDQLYPDPKGPNAVPPPPNIKLEIEKMKAQSKQAQMQLDMKMAMAKLMSEVELNKAKVQKLEAEAIKALAEAGGVDVGHQIELIKTQIEAEKNQQHGLMKSLEILSKVMEKSDDSDTSGNDGMGKQPSDSGVSKQPQAS